MCLLFVDISISPNVFIHVTNCEVNRQYYNEVIEFDAKFQHFICCEKYDGVVNEIDSNKTKEHIYHSYIIYMYV